MLNKELATFNLRGMFLLVNIFNIIIKHYNYKYETVFYHFTMAIRIKNMPLKIVSETGL